MKKTLITGAGGFIGSHLVEKCVKEGLNVKAFIRYNSSQNWGWLENSNIRNDVEIVLGDIRDFDSVNRAAKDCDTIFHLAALIGIPYSYESPLAYIKTNIEGTYNILEVSRLKSIENLIVTSTSETYGTAQYIPINESHPAVGQSPYAASKIAADQLSLSYWRSFGVPVKIIRPFNTYGPRQSNRAIIPTVLTQILNGNLRLRIGNLSPSRDLTFVKDTVAAFYAISQCNEAVGEAINVGMNKTISIRDLIELISKIMKVEITYEIESERKRPSNSEVEKLICDNSKLLEKTDWRPTYSLENGLLETIAWLQKNIKKYKTDRYIK